MNGSRSANHSQGERSSLDALNRTIEGLEARIEDLIGASSADAGRHRSGLRPRPEARSEVLGEIRERQKMLDLERERAARAAIGQSRRPYQHEDEPQQDRHRFAAPPQSKPQNNAGEPDRRALREIAEALVSLREDLRHDISEGVAREMDALRSEIRSIKTIAQDQHFADDLRGDLARLAEGIDRIGHGQSPEAAALRADFDDLRAVMDGFAREDSLRRVESRFQSVEDRFHESDTQILRDELVALAYRIDDIKAQLGDMNHNPAIRTLEQKLIAMATAMEQLGTRLQPGDALTGEHFAVLDQRLDDISRAIEADRHAAMAGFDDSIALQRLESRLAALADQIDGIAQTGGFGGDAAGLLSTRIEALGDRIQDLSDERAALRLEERLDQLALILRENQRGDDHTALFGHLNDISDKIDGLERGTLNDALSERLDDLARRIDAIEVSPQPLADLQAFGRLEDRLSDIAERLERAPRGGETALGPLEEQIAHLSALLARPQASGSLPADFDARMASIENYIATGDEYIIEAARHAAETVVEAYSRKSGAAALAPADMEALSGLADDLRHLEDLTRGSEERSRATFEALHATLVQIANRLDGMEERIATAGQSVAPHPVHAAISRVDEAGIGRRAAGAPQPPQAIEDEVTEEIAAPAVDSATEAASEPRKSGLMKLFSRRGAAAQARTEPESVAIEALPAAIAPVASPAADPAANEHDLLEPGSGVPDVKKILERVRASQAAGDFEGQRAGGNDRADFIAAARRAAKAAAQETDVQPGGAAARDLRKAALQSGGGAMEGLARYRRPLMLAAGAALLVLLALPLARNFLGAGAQPSAAIETTAEEDRSQADAAVQVDAAVQPGDGTAALADIVQDQTDTTAEAVVDAAPQIAADATTAPEPLAETAQLRQPPATGVNASIIVPDGISPPSLAQAASEGDANALFEIASRFNEGRGVEKDVSEAANWYRLAAERGLAPAQYLIGNLFEKGNGVERDLPRAVGYYEQAASAGNASAMHNLGVVYASGALGETDMVKAAAWFGRAAELDIADSQFNLAILNARGNGLRQNLEDSYKWFALAARNGDEDAAGKRDEVANALTREQLESARAKVEAFKPRALDEDANRVNIPDAWTDSQAQPTASIDMEKAIRNIQAILNKNGFASGTPDGKMGARTVAAIKAFQKSVGQEPTGQVTDALVKELLARNK